jgi:pimeloyl-ACP methyl ester carboxylesterase
VDRRHFLAIAGGSFVALAGCSGDTGDQSTPDSEATPTPDATPTPVVTATPTPIQDETPTPEQDATPTPEQDATPEPPAQQPESTVEAAELFVEHLSAGQFDVAYQQLGPAAQNQSSAGELEAVWLALTNVGGSYEGIAGTEETVQSGFDAVDATLGFERGEHTLRVLTGDKFAVVGAVINDEYESPSYVESSAFTETSTSLETESCLMEATATVPEGGDDAPGVVLVHGSDPSGAADKNLTTGGSAVFRDLAEGLSSQGVAVLRYDRRTHACPNSITPSGYTLDSVSVDDALVALERLRGVDGVDSDSVGVVGLSLGALSVPRIAQRDGDLVGAVAMAAPARSFHEIFVDQYEHLATVGEYEWDKMQQAYDRWRDRIDRIREGDYSPGDIVLGYPGALWNSLDEYDHVGTARDIDTPLYFLQGERDYQVSPEKDFGKWQSELADRSDTDFQRYEGLNHVFQYGTGPSVPGEYAAQNSLDESVVGDIAEWLTSTA